MSKDVNRSAYTRRILEIIGNIRKQKEEISKVSLSLFIFLAVLSFYVSFMGARYSCVDPC